MVTLAVFQFDKPFWLSKGRSAYHLVTLKPEHISIRGALIPDQDDETSEIERMIEDGCPMVWLPKSGIIKEKIYSELELINKMTKIPLVAIGGINSKNYKKLLLNKANFLAISSYVWNNKKYKPSEAIKIIK